MSNPVQQATKDDGFQRTLGRKDLLGIAIGGIIGAGVMTLTGIGIGRTGRSVCISYLLATFFALFFAVPSIISSSVARFKGGNYTLWSILVGPRWNGAWVIAFILGEMGVSMYAMSFAEYFQVLVPGVPTQVIAIVIATLFFGLNYFGINIFAKVENILTVTLLLGIILYIVCGLPHVQWDTYFTNPGFTTNGISGVFAGAAFLNYAVIGGTWCMDFSAEAKNAKKDIPFAIIVSTVIVAVMFSLLSIVASGVLPLDQVAGQPLTVVGKVIFNKPLFYCFLIAGALGATATTLNVCVAALCRPLVWASRDGWFPKKMGELHPKYHTPHRWLLVWYVICITPILLDFSVAQVADLVMFIMYTRSIIYAFSFLRLPKLFPDQWKKSIFHMPDWAYKALILATAGVATYQVIANLQNADPKMIIINLVVMAGALIYSEIRWRSGKVHMEPAWEEN